MEKGGVLTKWQPGQSVYWDEVGTDGTGGGGSPPKLGADGKHWAGTKWGPEKNDDQGRKETGCQPPFCPAFLLTLSPPLFILPSLSPYRRESRGSEHDFNFQKNWFSLVQMMQIPNTPHHTYAPRQAVLFDRISRCLGESAGAGGCDCIWDENAFCLYQMKLLPLIFHILPVGPAV